MKDFPDPLVPKEVDLRDFDFIPFEFRRLLSSDTWILGTAEERCAALCLWCESWHQIPSGSIPDSEKMLSRLSQSGVRWRKVKAHALRGWIKCSDGRLYHPVVAEKALEAWARHKNASSKGKAGAAKRWGTGIGTGIGTGNATAIAQAMPAPMPNDSYRQGQGHRPTNDTSSTQSLVAPVGKVTPAGAWAIDLKRRGVKVTSMHPTLLQWIEDGFTLSQVVEALQLARAHKPEPQPIPPNYLDPILRNPPKKQEPQWWTDDNQITKKAETLGITTYGKQRDQLKTEIFAAIKAGKQTTLLQVIDEEAARRLPHPTETTPDENLFEQ